MYAFRVLAIVVAFLGVGNTANAQISTVDGMESFIDNFVLSRLPDPTGDAVNVVRAFPDIYKGALILWLNGKVTDAATKEDWVHHDRYYAFFTCISKNDCQALQALQPEQSCTQWNVSGQWQINQSNGYTPIFDLQQNGNQIEGQATSGTAVAPVTGSVINDRFDVLVTWSSNSRGRYTGTVRPGMISDGESHDEANPGSRASWSGTGPANCVQR